MSQGLNPNDLPTFSYARNSYERGWNDCVLLAKEIVKKRDELVTQEFIDSFIQRHRTLGEKALGEKGKGSPSLKGEPSFG